MSGEHRGRGVSLAKTTRPSAGNVLPRERLFAALDAGRRASLLWVHGPPGCGKTSLVSSYLDARASHGLWYQLDPGDADPATLCLYLGDAVAGNGNGDGARRLPLFTAEYRAEPQAFARHYFRRLFDVLAPPFLLVFDNYHELPADSGVHAMLREAAAELPAEGCVVVLSREPPPAAFIRLRANRELEVLDWDALRLSREESDAIVQAHLGVADAGALAALYERTDGWAAVLILALEQGAGAAAWLPGPGGAPQLLFDYLAAEVVAGFDEPVRELLMRTAFVEEMGVELAAALSGDPHAGERLHAATARHQMLTVKPGPRGPVYACHPLLREVLLAQALATLPGDERERIVLDAAGILERDGAADAALRLLAAHGRDRELADTVRRCAASVLAEGRIQTLERWLAQVPAAHRERDPWLSYWRGACRFQHDPGEAVALLAGAHDLFVAHRPDDLDGQALAAAHAMHAVILALEDFAALDPWIRRAEALDGRDLGEQARGRLAVSQFMALVFRQPHHPRIGEWAERALDASRSLNDAGLRLSTQLLLAINLNYTGQFDRALEFLAALRGAADAPGAPPLERTTLKAVESMYHMLNAKAEPCLKAVFDGLEIGEETGVQLWSYHLLSNGVAGALGAGDLDTASELLERMQDYAQGARRLDRSGYHYYRAWHAMLRADLDAAAREQRQALALAEETGCPFYAALCRLALAQIVAARGDLAQAGAHVGQVRAVARRINNRLLEFQTLLGFADVAQTAGRRRLAAGVLRRALRVGREHGFRHTLWWLPGAMSRLAALALQEGVETRYVRALIRERGLRPPRDGAARAAWPWPVEIRSLGGFRLRPGPDAPAVRLSGKPLALLKTLVGFGGRMDEGTAAALVWPRVDADYARRSLATTLHRLRKLLGEDGAVVLRHGRLRLDRDRCRLDLDALGELLAAIEATDGDGRPAERAHALATLGARLLDVYAGPFMDGEDEEAFAPLRERTRNRVVGALDAVARACEDAGVPERALALYRRAIDQDPMAEAVHRRLMLTLRDLGRPADAVEAYARCKSALEAAAGASPSPETQALYDAVCRDL